MQYRCNNKNSKSYKDYGGRGIRVRLGRRDFVSWFVYHGRKFMKRYPGVRFGVGRTDHDLDYRYNNISLVSVRENSMEAMGRIRICSVCKKKLHSTVGD